MHVLQTRPLLHAVPCGVYLQEQHPGAHWLACMPCPEHLSAGLHPTVARGYTDVRLLSALQPPPTCRPDRLHKRAHSTRMLLRAWPVPV